MNFEDEGYVGSLDLVLANAERDRRDADEQEDRAEKSRRMVDDAREALAVLAEPAVAVLAMRVLGVAVDGAGRPVTENREKAALAVLDRVGIPKLRAHAIAASVAQAPRRAAQGSPGWEPDEVEGGADGELEKGQVDAQIDAFLDGARVARDLAGG